MLFACLSPGGIYAAPTIAASRTGGMHAARYSTTRTPDGTLNVNIDAGMLPLVRIRERLTVRIRIFSSNSNRRGRPAVLEGGARVGYGAVHRRACPLCRLPRFTTPSPQGSG